MKNELKNYLDFAINTAKKAGNSIKKAFGEHIQIDYKGRHDLVTKYDRETEDLIVKEINKTYPDHQILGEEGTNKETNSKFRWIIDPIDGTTNFTHGHSVFAVSIGLEIDGEIEVGVVYAPILNELYHASKANGAYLNNKKIHVSKIKTIDESLLATGFNPRWKEKNFKHHKHFETQSQGIRRCGSASIDLCFVAAGRYEAYWEKGLKPWDLAAGKILVEEAGGKVTNLIKEDFDIEIDDIIASNSLIHEEIMNYFKLNKNNI